MKPASREDGFRGPQVCAVVGITYRQLDYWARTGLQRPSVADARGSGTQRLYSYRDLLELKVIKQLLDAGVNLREARRAVECLRGAGDDLATANLVLGGAGTVLARSGEEIVDLLRGGQGVFNIVPLAGVVGDVDAAIVGLELRRGSETSSDSGDVASSSGHPAGVAEAATATLRGMAGRG